MKYSELYVDAEGNCCGGLPHLEITHNLQKLAFGTKSIKLLKIKMLIGDA
jgi:hypothetical protein